MIRLLILHSRGNQVQGGTVTFLRHLLTYLDRTQFEPHLVFLSPGELARQFEPLAASVAVLEVPHIRQLGRTGAAICRLGRFIKDRDIHLVFSNEGRAHILGGLAALANRRPAWWYCHGIGDRVEGLDRLVAIVPVDLVLTHGIYTESLLRERFPRLPTHVLHLGIEIPPTPLPSPGIRQSLGIPENCPLIGSVGMLTAWKGQDILLQALPQIRAHIPEVQALIVGDAPFESDKPFVQKLHDLVEDLNLQESVVFTGFRTDILDLMAACDLFVHTSVSPEPFGIVLLEAMAVERPVIASAEGGPCEIIDDGETGILVPPGDPEALAQACISLLQDPCRRQAMGRNMSPGISRQQRWPGSLRPL